MAVKAAPVKFAAAHGIEVMPHNPLGPIRTAASVHLAAALPNHGFLECWETPGDPNARRQISPVFPRRFEFEDAQFPSLPSPVLSEAREPSSPTVASATGIRDCLQSLLGFSH